MRCSNTVQALTIICDDDVAAFDALSYEVRIRSNGPENHMRRTFSVLTLPKTFSKFSLCVKT